MQNSKEGIENSEYENIKIDDMKICQPDKYELTFRSVAPDGKSHQCVFNKEKYRIAYVHNKLNREDDSWYSPYLIYEIGKKVGVDVPETEIAILLHRNINRENYSTSWFESSLVYDNEEMYNKNMRLYDNISYVSPEVIESDYFLRGNKTQNKNLPICSIGIPDIDTHINSYIWYLTNYGNKPQNQYTSEEIDKMRQELIDRIMFSLRFDSYGNFGIKLINYRNASLEPYYPSRLSMYFLNLSEESTKKYLEESDADFKELLDSKYEPQYVGQSMTQDLQDTKSILRYLFNKYPKQADEAYRKISAFKTGDLEKILDTCTRMSGSHKKIAMRSFEARGKDFDEVHQEHVRREDQIR